MNFLLDNPMLVSIGALLLALPLVWWLARRPSAAKTAAAEGERLDTLAGWPPEPTRIMRPSERIAFSTLRMALPGYLILAQVPISRFISVPKRNSHVEWMRRIGNQCVDFLICDVTSKVIAVVEVMPPSEQITERLRARAERIERSLGAAGIKVHTWHEERLPSIESARLKIVPNAPAIPTDMRRRAVFASAVPETVVAAAAPVAGFAMADLALAEALTVLAAVAVDDEQHLVRRTGLRLADRALDLAELLHQVRLRREAPRRVGDDDVGAARLAGDDRVEGDAGRVAALLRDDLDLRSIRLAGPHRPCHELLARRGAECVGGGQQHLAVGVHQVARQLADGRRLAGAVDAADHHHGRHGFADHEVALERQQQLGEDPGQQLAHRLRVTELQAGDAPAQLVEQPDGRLGAGVGLQQRRLEVLVELVGQLGADERLGERRAGAPEPAAQASEPVVAGLAVAGSNANGRFGDRRGRGSCDRSVCGEGGRCGGGRRRDGGGRGDGRGRDGSGRLGRRRVARRRRLAAQQLADVGVQPIAERAARLAGRRIAVALEESEHRRGSARKAPR